MVFGAVRPAGVSSRRGWAVLAAVVVVASVFSVPGLIASGVAHRPALESTDFGGTIPAGPDASRSAPHSGVTISAAAPEFSSASAGRVTRTVFPGFNTSLPGSFTSSVATWVVGTPTYVPSTNSLWFPQRAVSVPGDPTPTVAPAAVFNLTSGGFDRLVTNLSNASALVYDPGNGDIYATIPANNSVEVVNPRTGAVLAPPIPVGSAPSALAFDPNTNQLFVANSGSSNVTIINTLQNKVSTGSISVGDDPDSVVFDPIDDLVFVANGGNKWISVINMTEPSYPVTEVTLIFGPAAALAYSSRSDTVVASVPSSQYATIINASPLGAITEDAPVGLGVVAAVDSFNGTEFVLGNSTGGNLVVLNSTTGATVNAGISAEKNATELIVDPATALVYCWGSENRVLQSLNLSTNVVQLVTESAFPQLSSISYAAGSTAVNSAATNDLLIYSLGPESLVQLSKVIASTSTPLSVVADPTANRFFVGTTDGVSVYNASTDRLTGSVTGFTTNCSRLVLDRPDNLLWLSNSLQGVVAVNLTTLHVVITTSLVIPAQVTQGIAVDNLDSETFVLTSTSAVTVLDSHTGDVVTAGLTVGTNVTSLAFDPADDQVYAAGDEVSFVDGATLSVEGGVAPFGGAHRVLAEAYDPSREAVYIASVGLLPGSQGTVTVIDGASVAAGETSAVEVPVGEDPAALAVVTVTSSNTTGLGMVWVANELSGTISVISTPPQITFFAATPSSVDLGYSTSVSVAVEGGAGSVTLAYWGLPPGCSSVNEPEWNCTPTASGSFQLEVVVTDSLDVTANATTSLTVLPSLTLKTRFVPSTFPEVDVGFPLVGTATPSGGLAPYAYSWTFGDGTNASGRSVLHTYLAPGAYVISVQVRDATGASTNSSFVALVVPRPTVGIVLKPGNATDVDFPVSLTTTVTGGTGPSQESWKFGDGTEAVGANVSHAWTRAGNYTVTLQYVDDLGVSANHSVNITVHPTLTAIFSSGNVSSSSPAAPGAPVTFTSSVAGGTPPYLVTWSFGDGSMATGASVVHSYGASGTYTVTVTVTDAVGETTPPTNLSVLVASPATSSGLISSLGGGFATGLFLGLVLGGVLAAVVLFLAGPRKGERPPLTPAPPYVPP